MESDASIEISDLKAFCDLLLDKSKTDSFYNTLVKKRIYLLTSYPNCFIGTEAVDWFIQQKFARDRPTAVKLGRKLLQEGIIHHVSDDHHFSDSHLFYRFLVDEREQVQKSFAEQSAIATTKHALKSGWMSRRANSFTSHARYFVLTKRENGPGQLLRYKTDVALLPLQVIDLEPYNISIAPSDTKEAFGFALQYKTPPAGRRESIFSLGSDMKDAEVFMLVSEHEMKSWLDAFEKASISILKSEEGRSSIPRAPELTHDLQALQDALDSIVIETLPADSTALPRAPARRLDELTGPIDSLRQAFQGPVLEPGDDGYQQAVALHNNRFQREPRVIVLPMCEDDVVKALEFAQRLGIKFSIKNGGHSAGGFSSNNDGLVLDMSKMDSIQVSEDRQSVTLGAGCIWKHVYRTLKPYGVICVGGDCSTVGVCGFTLGGGYGFLARSHGLGCDNMLAARIVLSNGKVIEVSDKCESPEERELFWALRGAGSQNFGVITQLTLRLHVPKVSVAGELCWYLPNAPEALTKYNDWASTVEDAMTAYGWIGTLRNGQKAFCLHFAFNGPFGDAMTALKPMLDMAPDSTDFGRKTIFEWLEHIELYTSSSTKMCYYIKSGIFPAYGYNENVLKEFLARIADAPSDLSTIVWTHAGGAINKRLPDDVAYPHRSAMFIYEVKAKWLQKTEAANSIQWANSLQEGVESYFMENATYSNFTDPCLIDWQTAYYGANYARLRKIKKHWDPNNFFRYQQSIAPEDDDESSAEYRKCTASFDFVHNVVHTRESLNEMKMKQINKKEGGGGARGGSFRGASASSSPKISSVERQ